MSQQSWTMGAKDVQLASVFAAQLTGMATVLPVITPEVTGVL